MKFKAQYDLDLTPLESLRAYGLRKALRIAGNRAAAKVKASEVRTAEAVKLFGLLAKSIRIRVKVYGAFGERFVSIVGPSSKFKRNRGKYTRGKRKGQPRVKQPSRYAHLLERGTGRSRPRPWLKPAYDESAGRYLEDVRREVAAEIEKELTRRSAK